MCDDIIDTLTNHYTVSKQDCPLLSWWVTLPAVAASPNGLHYRIASTISISYLSWWFALPAVAASPDGLHYQQWLPDFWTAVVISPVHQNLDVERVICHKTPHPVCDVLEYYASLWHYTHLTFAIRNIWILGCFHDTLKKLRPYLDWIYSCLAGEESLSIYLFEKLFWFSLERLQPLWIKTLALVSNGHAQHPTEVPNALHLHMVDQWDNGGQASSSRGK